MKDNTFVTKDATGKDITLKIKPLSKEMQFAAQGVYQEAFDEARKNGFKLHLVREKMLEAEGLLDTSADEQRRDELRKELRALEVKLRKGVIAGRRMSKADGKEIAIKMRKIRDEIQNIGAGLMAFFQDTVESIARERQNQYLIYISIVDEDDVPYWTDFTSFLNDESVARAQATKHFWLTHYKVDADFELKFFENLWLKRQGFLNDKLQFVNEFGQLTDENGRRINEAGQYINESGKAVDMFGYEIDKDGNLLEPDTWVYTEVPQQAS